MVCPCVWSIALRPFEKSIMLYKKWICVALLASTTAAVANTALAYDDGANTAIGAVAVALIGGAVGSSNGAIVVGVLGAAVGATSGGDVLPAAAILSPSPGVCRACQQRLVRVGHIMATISADAGLNQRTTAPQNAASGSPPKRRFCMLKILADCRFFAIDSIIGSL